MALGRPEPSHQWRSPPSLPEASRPLTNQFLAGGHQPPSLLDFRKKTSCPILPHTQAEPPSPQERRLTWKGRRHVPGPRADGPSRRSQERQQPTPEETATVQLCRASVIQTRPFPLQTSVSPRILRKRGRRPDTVYWHQLAVKAFVTPASGPGPHANSAGGFFLLPRPAEEEAG